MATIEIDDNERAVMDVGLTRYKSFLQTMQRVLVKEPVVVGSKEEEEKDYALSFATKSIEVIDGILPKIAPELPISENPQEPIQ